MDTTSNNSYYWNLTLKDGQVIPIPPEFVDVVKRKLAVKDPVVTSRGVYPFSEIRGFDQTARQKEEALLLEEAAQAFKEPLFNDEKEIKARWIKKQVTNGEYTKYYRPSPGYRRLGDEDGGMVWVAFILPVHLIDIHKHHYCSPDEIKSLTKQQR